MSDHTPADEVARGHRALGHLSAATDDALASTHGDGNARAQLWEAAGLAVREAIRRADVDVNNMFREEAGLPAIPDD